MGPEARGAQKKAGAETGPGLLGAEGWRPFSSSVKHPYLAGGGGGWTQEVAAAPCRGPCPCHRDPCPCRRSRAHTLAMTLPMPMSKLGAIFLASRRKAVIFSCIWSLRAFTSFCLAWMAVLIRFLRLPQGRQFRMLDHHLLAQAGGVGMHLFLEVKNLPRLLRGQIHHPRAVAHALTHGLGPD